jgi:hypothetical protein
MPARGDRSHFATSPNNVKTDGTFLILAVSATACPVVSTSFNGCVSTSFNGCVSTSFNGCVSTYAKSCISSCVSTTKHLAELC